MSNRSAVQRNRRVTITDVAAEAGVSRAAVSKVLRDAYGVSDSMRTRVDAAIAKLNYRPLVSARGMRMSTQTIGVTLPDTSNHFFYEVIRGALGALEDTAYQLLIVPSGTEPDSNERAMEALYDRQVDGIIALSPTVDPQFIERTAQIVPIVELGRHDEAENYDTVVGDDWLGSRLVLEHLRHLGHTRIAHVTQAEPVTHPTALTPPEIRRRVYEDFMRDNHLEDHIQVLVARYAEIDAYRTTREVLTLGSIPTAIFAGNDDAAFGVLHALEDAGLSDIAVAGYDNSPLSGHPRLSLTSVDQSGPEMGALAVRMLLERIDGRDEPRHETLAPNLVARRSTEVPVRLSQ